MNHAEILEHRAAAHTRARDRPTGAAVGRVTDGHCAAIPVRLYQADRTTPSAAKVVFLHGGYFVLGDLDLQDSVCRRIARDLDLDVVSVDYPLAPEHHAEATVAAVVKVCLDLLSGSGPLIIWGDSAGGAVAILTAVALLQEGARAPSLMLTNPNLDLTLQLYDDDAPCGPGKALLEAGIRAWTSGCVETVNPLALDVSGLDAVVVSVGAEDALVEEARAFIARSTADWTLLAHPGVGHGFVSGQSPADVAAMDRTIRAVHQLRHG